MPYDFDDLRQTPDAIDAPSADWEDMEAQRRLPRLLMKPNATQAIKAAGTAYLPMWEKESDKEYARRIADSSFVNYYGETVRDFADLMYREPLQTESLPESTERGVGERRRAGSHRGPVLQGPIRGVHRRGDQPQSSWTSRRSTSRGPTAGRLPGRRSSSQASASPCGRPSAPTGPSRPCRWSWTARRSWAGCGTWTSRTFLTAPGEAAASTSSRPTTGATRTRPRTRASASCATSCGG